MRWPWQKKKEEEVPVQSVVFEPAAVAAPLPRGVRRGMWVTVGGELPAGIVTGPGSYPHEVLVDFVSPDNGVLDTKTVPLEFLRQAKWEQIPESRRGITPEQARRLGYI